MESAPVLKSSSRVRDLLKGVAQAPCRPDGVRQDEAGARVRERRREEVLDLAGGLLLDPGVDRPAGHLGGAEVDRAEAGAERFGDEAEVFGAEVLPLLAPKSVRLAERVGPMGVAVDGPDQGAEVGGEAVGRGLEPEDAGHLGGRLASGAGVGHRQGGRDAVGGDEQVPRLRAEPAVEVRREPVAGRGHVLHALLLLLPGLPVDPGRDFEDRLLELADRRGGGVRVVLDALRLAVPAGRGRERRKVGDRLGVAVPQREEAHLLDEPGEAVEVLAGDLPLELAQAGGVGLSLIRGRAVGAEGDEVGRAGPGGSNT